MASSMDLVQMLKDLQIYNSIDNFFNPDHSQLMVIYEKFCDLINFDENLQLENGALSLFYRCKLMCRTVGIPDFQMMDIIDPEAKRMKNILAQLCKYCFWQREQIAKWEKKNKEIVIIFFDEQMQMEEVDAIDAKKQKAQLEDIIAVKSKDLDLRRKRFDQLKQMKAKVDLEIQSKKNLKQKLVQSIQSNQNELNDSSKKYYNLQEKFKVAQNELNILETMIVRDPKILEQRMNDSQKRMEGLSNEVEKCQKEIRLEEFKIEKIYMALLHDYETFARLLASIQENQQEMNELKKQSDKLNEQLLFCTNKTITEENSLQKLQSDKQQLEAQKALQSEKDSTTNQYSLQSLIDLQKQLQEFQQQVKNEQQQYLSVQLTRQEHQRQLIESDKVKTAIEANLKQVVSQQLLEVSQYAKNIENLINKIELE